MPSERPALTRMQENADDVAKKPGEGDGVITDEVAGDESEMVEEALQYFDTVDETAHELPSTEEADRDESEEAPVLPAAKTTVEPPVATPAGEQVVETPVQVVTQPVVPPAVQPGTPPVPAASQPGQEFDQLVTAMEQNRENIVKNIASSYETTFTDEDIDNFQSADPKVAKKALAAMAGRLQVDVVQNILGVIAHNLPKMVDGRFNAQRVNSDAETEFYGANPDLKAHKQSVDATAAVVRAQNPNMPKEEFIATVAAVVRSTKKLAAPAPKAPKPKAGAKGGFRPAPSAGRPDVNQRQPRGGTNDWGGAIFDIVDAADNGAFER